MSYVIHMVSFSKTKDRWIRWGSLELFIPLVGHDPHEYGETLFIGESPHKLDGWKLDGLGCSVTMLGKEPSWKRPGYCAIPLCGQCLQYVRKTLFDLRDSPIGTKVDWACGATPHCLRGTFTCRNDLQKTAEE